VGDGSASGDEIDRRFSWEFVEENGKGNVACPGKKVMERKSHNCTKPLHDHFNLSARHNTVTGRGNWGSGKGDVCI